MKIHRMMQNHVEYENLAHIENIEEERSRTKLNPESNDREKGKLPTMKIYCT